MVAMPVTRAVPPVVSRLQAVLDEKGMTQAAAAEAAGVNIATVHRLCRNATTMASFETLAALCDALDVEPGDLLVRSRKGKR